MNTISNPACGSGEKRIVYLDYLRVLATLAVFLLHISSQNWKNTDVNTFQWQIFNFTDSISRWCVAVFVMISGALFLGRRHSIKKIYTKYIFRLVTAALFWGFLPRGEVDGKVLLDGVDRSLPLLSVHTEVIN